MEANNQKVSARIQQAECAILDRARALLNSPGDSLREGQALDDALYALRALKSCLELHGGFAIAELQSRRPRFQRSDGSLLA
jgi:hypothetical protein